MSKNNNAAIPVAMPIASGPDYSTMEKADKHNYATNTGANKYSQLEENDGYGWGQSSTYLVDAEKSLRMGFVRKVYSILMVQLLFTAGVSFLFIKSTAVKQFVLSNDWAIWTAYGSMLFLVIVLSCCGSFRRKHPHGMICLALFTISTAYVVGVTSLLYAETLGTDTLLEAVLMTAIITGALTAFAFQTKYDFTWSNGMFLSFFMIWIVFLMFMPLFPLTPITRTLYASIGAGFMCFFIVHDTQVMLGGKHKYSISVDEHVFAALNLYVDVINLFLHILRCLGGRR